jgi:hypothetical protein
MKHRILLLPILALLLLSSFGLQAQKGSKDQIVKDGYEVKQILLKKEAALRLKSSPLFDKVAVLKGATLYPQKGYKIIALQGGKSAGIVPIFYSPGTHTVNQFQKMTVKGILGGCFCPAGEGGCRLRPFVGRDGRRDFNCQGQCTCGAGLLIEGIGRMFEPLKKENMLNNGNWLNGNGSNIPGG